ncbi:hypothetical protein L249_7514 [Ophiocordyceps polyrhachis-furcata BCC 54312]|uniref:Exonuclease domain-containing protein n=1 Tax=Ophiocordyceps polyrhachis-furcata BCC 54312 TaxID=1330021 RepID=A0A367LB18_9HYPO|nr:hypothetical protein L249_7514 [Ophiocordyceps polyrhachis-furcata BCC 54312]
MAVECGPIPYTLVNVNRLHEFVLSRDELYHAGYVLGQLSSRDLDMKRRCASCLRVVKPNNGRFPKQRQAPTAVSGTAPAARQYSTVAQPAPSPAFDIDAVFEQLTVSATRKKTEEPKAPIMRCRFHPGQRWTCCRNYTHSKACTSSEWHTPRLYAAGELEMNWVFYTTPSAPAPVQFAAAVVIDCEMGTAESGDSELIRVSVVDFFTRDILVDKLVMPDVKLAHYNTRYSGISKPMMDDALRRGNCFLGRDEARMAVLRLVGPNTVVVGHAGNQDLTSLRWIHPLVIDTLCIEKKRRKFDQGTNNDTSAAPRRKNSGPQQPKEEDKDDGDEAPAKREAGMSLKALASEKLNRQIQTKGKGHDSVEDALATRDLLLWYMTHPAAH